MEVKSDIKWQRLDKHKERTTSAFSFVTLEVNAEEKKGFSFHNNFFMNTALARINIEIKSGE